MPATTTQKVVTLKPATFLVTGVMQHYLYSSQTGKGTTQTATILKQVNKIVSVFSSELPTLPRGLNKRVLLFSPTQALTTSRPIQRYKLVSLFGPTQAASLLRTTNKIVSTAHTQLTTLFRATQKIVTVFQTQLVLLFRTANKIITTMVTTQAVTLTMVKALNRIISLTEGQVVLLSRTINKTVSLFTSYSLTLLRAVTKRVTMLSARSLTVSAVSWRYLLLSMLSARAMIFTAVKRQVTNQLAISLMRVGQSLVFGARKPTAKAITSKHSFSVTGVMGLALRKAAVTGKGTSEKVTVQKGRVKGLQVFQSQALTVAKAHRFALLLTQGVGQKLAATLRPSVLNITVYTTQLVPRMTWLIKLASLTQAEQTTQTQTVTVREPTQLILNMVSTFKTFGVLAIQPLRSAVTGRGTRQIVSTIRTVVPSAGIHVLINVYQTQFIPTIGLLFGATQNTETIQSPLKQFITAVKRSATQTNVLVSLQSAQQITMSTLFQYSRTILMVTQNSMQTMGLLFTAPQKQVSLTSTQLASKTATYVQRATASVTAMLSSPQVVTVKQTVTKIIPLMVVQNMMPSMGQLYRATVQAVTMTTRQLVSVVPNPTGILNSKVVSMVSTQSMRLIRTTAKLLAMVRTDIATVKLPAVKMLLMQVGQQVSLNFTKPSDIFLRTTQLLSAGPSHAKRVLISVFGPSQKLIVSVARRVAIPVLAMTTTREVITLITRERRIWQKPIQLLQNWLLRLHLVRRSTIRSASKLIVCDTSFGSDEVLRQFKTPSYSPVYQSEAANCVFECGTDLNTAAAILLTIRRPDSTTYQIVGPTYSLYVGNRDLQTDEGIIFAESYVLYVSEVGEFYLPGVYTVQVSVPPFVGDPGYFTISPTPPYGTVPTPSTADTRDVTGS